MTAKQTIKVYLEVGKKRTFAAAMDWPGWCRIGRDEASALQSLVEYGPRFAAVVRSARLGFQTPKDVSVFAITGRLKGNATTDFGAPDIAPSIDLKRVSDAELWRLQSILKACWKAFDATVESAHGKSLRAGPRGGGRSVTGIVEHVVGAEQGYLSRLGGKAPKGATIGQLRETIIETMEASARGEIAKVGPRAGRRWSVTFFVRRAAWHVLDHLWEIEDRSHT